MVRFVVVGGGAAGWITSHYLKRNLDCELTVVHKKENEIIGVGESTTPTILKVIEDVKSWQEDSKALIKYGIKFNDWLRPNSEWYHLFEDAFTFLASSRSEISSSFVVALLCKTARANPKAPDTPIAGAPRTTNVLIASATC